MAQVLVRNKNVHPYKEKFQDNWVEIAAGEAIKMDADEAKHFLSRCNGVKIDGDGQPDPCGFKMLFIEPIDGVKVEPAKVPGYVSHRDGKEFATKKELETHLDQFKDKIVVDEDAERAIAARKAPRQKRAGAA